MDKDSGVISDEDDTLLVVERNGSSGSKLNVDAAEFTPEFGDVVQPVIVDNDDEIRNEDTDVEENSDVLGFAESEEDQFCKDGDEDLQDDDDILPRRSAHNRQEKNMFTYDEIGGNPLHKNR